MAQLIAQLRPRAERCLQQQGLQWSDVLPMLEAVDSQEELQQVLQDPEFVFFEEIVEQFRWISCKEAFAF